jgi:hypothetical protein
MDAKEQTDLGDAMLAARDVIATMFPGQDVHVTADCWRFHDQSDVKLRYEAVVYEKNGDHSDYRVAGGSPSALVEQLRTEKAHRQPQPRVEVATTNGSEFRPIANTPAASETIPDDAGDDAARDEGYHGSAHQRQAEDADLQAEQERER